MVVQYIQYRAEVQSIKSSNIKQAYYCTGAPMHCLNKNKCFTLQLGLLQKDHWANVEIHSVANGRKHNEVPSER